MRRHRENLNVYVKVKAAKPKRLQTVCFKLSDIQEKAEDQCLPKFGTRGGRGTGRTQRISGQVKLLYMIL